MATWKKFQTLVPLNHKVGSVFEVVGEPKLPKWFRVELLNDPKRIYVEPWLVEIMFGKDGEHILHVESMLRTVIHVNVWGPEKRAEIWVFGPPNLQKDVVQMLTEVAHFCRMKLMEKEALEAGEERRRLMATRKGASQSAPVKVREAATLPTLVKVLEGATQSVPMKVFEAATQSSPMKVFEAATQSAPMEVREAATQSAPGKVCEAATQPAPGKVCEAATQPAPVKVREPATQLAPVQVREAASQETPVEVADATQLAQLKAGEAFSQHTSGEVHQVVNGQSPIEVCEAVTQQHSVDVSKDLSQKCPEVFEWETQGSLDGSYVIVQPPRTVWEPFIML